MRDFVLGVLLAALGVAFTFVYAATIAPKQLRPNEWPEAVGAAAHADPLPIPKPPGPGGSCPNGYLASGSYCVPSQGAQEAIPLPRGGNCPFGWLASGNACLKSGRAR